MREYSDLVRVTSVTDGMTYSMVFGPGLLETATHHDVGENGYRKITTLVLTSPWYRNNGKETKK